jgi:AAA+ superfamily predicted ATPase
MPDTFEFTLLRCHAQQGRIVAVAPLYRRMEANDVVASLRTALIDARFAVWSDTENKGRLAVDRLLAFAGRLTPLLAPQDFQKAAVAYPDLMMLSPLGRYYPDVIAPELTTETLQARLADRPPARYALPGEDGGDADGLRLVTVLFKDHLHDDYILRQLLVDPEGLASSVLLYLDTVDDGRLQPVAAFDGAVEGFWPTENRTPVKARKKGPVADPLSSTLSVLLDIALERQGMLAVDPDELPGRGIEWLADALAERKVVALVTDIPFGEKGFVRAMQPMVGLPLITAEPLGPTELMLNVAVPPGPAFIVLPMIAYPQLADSERVAYGLTSSEHAVLIACANLASLPECLRTVIETTITLPRMDREIFERAFFAVYGVRANGLGDDGASTAWLPYVLPTDVARIARSVNDPEQACVLLRRRVEERIARLKPMHGPSLGDLSGLGEAKVRAEMLIADIRAALDGHIPWSAVDRGMLLVGPPGCGKTSLARAIAKDCGVHFLECSAARWQMAGYLNDHLAAMARDFKEARRFSPSILFLDELDSIGNRETFTGNNASYSTQVVNALLAELQGFSDREKVIVIGATNNVAGIDPALRRAGRLDRVIEVTLPTIEALEKIFVYYFKLHNVANGDGSDIVLRPLAEAAFGRTGADVSLAVRGALRRARLAGRAVCQDDLLAELFNRPLEADLARPLLGEGLRRVAIHEAGHAALRLACGEALGAIAYISIIPRPDGTLGFVSSRPNPDIATLTRADCLALMDVMLGGRAAEEAFYGPEAVGAGAGGGAGSDLAKAMGLARDMVCRLGLGRELRLCWREEPEAGDDREAEALLAEAYERAKAGIEARRDLVTRVADALVARQEMSGEELRLLLDGASQ